MRFYSKSILSLMILLGLVFPTSGVASPSNNDESGRDYVVYSVFQALNMTDDPKDKPPKDYYINMGKNQGVRKGAILEVRRRIPTYDLISEQLYRDLTVPVALIKVIHVESVAAIGRLEKLLPLKTTPMVSPRFIMVGDLVRFPQK